MLLNCLWLVQEIHCHFHIHSYIMLTLALLNIFIAGFQHLSNWYVLVLFPSRVLILRFIELRSMVLSSHEILNCLF